MRTTNRPKQSSRKEIATVSVVEAGIVGLVVWFYSPRQSKPSWCLFELLRVGVVHGSSLLATHSLSPHITAHPSEIFHFISTPFIAAVVLDRHPTSLAAIECFSPVPGLRLALLPDRYRPLLSAPGPYSGFIAQFMSRS